MTTKPVRTVKITEGITQQFWADRRKPNYFARADVTIEGKRHQPGKTHATERDARKWLTAKTAELLAGESVETPAGVRTVEIACAKYLSGRRTTLAASTYDSYYYGLVPVRAVYGEDPIQDLTLDDLDDLIADLEVNGYPRKDGQPCKPWGSSYVNSLIKATRQVLARDIRQGFVTRANQADLLDKRSSETKPAQTFTKEQLEHLFAKARDNHDRYAIVWRLGLSGLRRAEVSGLRWADIDLNAPHLDDEHLGTIWVGLNTRLAIKRNGQSVEKGAKSRAGKRLLEIPPAMRAELIRTKDLQTLECIDAGNLWEESGYVVVNEIGQPPAARTLYDMWLKMLARVDLPRITFHEARHTCGTLLAQDGVAATMIAAWLGHRDSIITQQVYMTPQARALGRVSGSPSLSIGGSVESNNDLGDSHK